jgi:hypothetical protein
MKQISLPIEEIVGNEEFVQKAMAAALITNNSHIETGFTVWYAPSFNAYRFEKGHPTTCEYSGKILIGDIVKGEKHQISSKRRLKYSQAAYYFGRDFSDYHKKVASDDEVALRTLCEIGAKVHFHPMSAEHKIHVALWGRPTKEELAKILNTGTNPSLRDIVSLNETRRENSLINPYSIIGYAPRTETGGVCVFYSAWQEKTAQPVNLEKHLDLTAKSGSPLPKDFNASRFYIVRPCGPLVKE